MHHLFDKRLAIVSASAISCKKRCSFDGLIIVYRWLGEVVLVPRKICRWDFAAKAGGGIKLILSIRIGVDFNLGVVFGPLHAKLELPIGVIDVPLSDKTSSAFLLLTIHVTFQTELDEICISAPLPVAYPYRWEFHGIVWIRYLLVQP